MEILVFVAAVLVVGFVVLAGQRKEFDDPKPMSNQHLLSAIAGQADWLEKMSRTPIETQNSSSTLKLAKMRRGYIARLCLEVVSRGDGSGGPGTQELKYPGATAAMNVFSETYEYAKRLEAEGNSKEVAATKAVKEKLFISNGVFYSTQWEVSQK
ncbi:hypothetical protein [Methylobacillus sp.]|uniref:hypothetical protein n=1 Tax=Methylobacillus sp. TaxID=56818 RepID=UPI002FE23917